MRSGCSPFAFYASAARRRQARASAFVARLGLEANDVLDEFLNLALAYESRETPSLQGFVAWLRTASAEIKRDMEIARDEVRVMTVHGAKGLEAPIVILADTTTEPQGPIQHQPRLLPLPAQDAAPGHAGPAGLDADQEGRHAADRRCARWPRVDEAEDEYRRLLYVAMTRAADRLVICGSDGERQAAARLLVRSRRRRRSSRIASRSRPTSAAARCCAIARRRRSRRRCRCSMLAPATTGGARAAGLAHARRAARGRDASRRSRPRSSTTRPRRSCAPAARRGGRRWRAAW